MTKFHIFFLGLTVCLFLFTRLYKISETPPSLYWDEASIGYNAYSILQTGKDEWGESFPIKFRAFGEFKLPVYIYTVAIFEKLFGLNEFAVRAPSVVFSALLLAVIFLLAVEFFGNYLTACLAVLFLAISPWFFIFSRTGYEAVAGLTFYFAGIYVAYRARSCSYYLLSVIFLFLSIYSYNSFKLLSPITMFLMLPSVFVNLNNFRARVFALTCAVFLISISAVVILSDFRAPGSRLSAVSILSRGQTWPSGAELFLNNYLSHFSPSFLLTSGDKNARSQLPGFGQINVFNAPFLILGLFFIAKRRLKCALLVIFGLLVAPIPPSLTYESPHALRSISAAPFLAIISAYGMVSVGDSLQFRRLFIGSAVAILLVSFFGYFKSFVTEYPKKSAEDWQYAYKRIFTSYAGSFNSYDKVIVTDKFAQPYIFALFYLKYDPEQFRREVSYNSIDTWGFSTVHGFGKFLFGIPKGERFLEGKLLIFASKEERVEGRFIGEINDFDGKPIIAVYEK